MPKQQTLLRTSERLTFKTCRQKWWWSYVDQLRPEESQTALFFGDLVHQALAAYYKPGRKRGPKPAKTFERLFNESADELGARIFSEGEFTDMLELGTGMLRGYVEMFADADEEWEVLSSEQTFEVPVRFELLGGGKQTFRYVGTFDGVWRNRATLRIAFKEFKTASNIDLTGLPMDEQAGGYWTFGPKWLRSQGILAEDEDLDQILYTFLRKAIPNPDWKYDAEGRKLNKDDSISKQQPAAYFVRHPVFRDRADKESVHARVLAEMKEMTAARAHELPVYKNPGPLHLPNCRFCGFRDMCELHEAGQDWQAMRDATMEGWDPYGQHERIERR